MNPALNVPVATTSHDLQTVLPAIVADRDLHAKWLNTLSFMEHVGATKIARTQNGPQTDFLTLKHTAEEARHAFFLKRLSRKVSENACPTYEAQYLLAPIQSKHYLHKLDVRVSRLIIEAGVPRDALRNLAYLLVTYAIEVRADSIYPIYQNLLNSYPIKLSVNSIINEEEGHLEEMRNALEKYPEKWRRLATRAEEIETLLYKDWVAALHAENAARI